MSDDNRFRRIRKELGISQERMARLLGVSYVSVNRWENNGSSPMGPTLDLYNALEAALNHRDGAAELRHSANGDRGKFLHRLFAMAYG